MFSLRLLRAECFSRSNPTHCSFIMSSCCIIGFFELMHGRRVDTDVNKPDGSVVTTKHDFYETCVVCSDAISMPAELRKYSPVKEVILRDKTVAYVVAKLNVPPAGGPLLLEAWHVAPVPGDPSSIDYNAHIPDFERPIVIGLGIVSAGPDGPPGGAVTFPVTVSDYVRGGVKESTVRYVVLCSFDRMLLTLFLFQVFVGQVDPTVEECSTAKSGITNRIHLTLLRTDRERCVVGRCRKYRFLLCFILTLRSLITFHQSCPQQASQIWTSRCSS
jgi:hypothetical protein